MFDDQDIGKILTCITNNNNENIQEMKRILCSDLYYVDSNGFTLLHHFVNDIAYDEEPKRLQAIHSLLDYGLSPNFEDITGQNFIQIAMYGGTTEQFILQLLSDAILYGLDVNHQDCSGNTVMHSAIFSDNYDIDELINIYNLLLKNNFNKNLVNKEGLDLVKAIAYTGTYSKEEIDVFKDLINLNKEVVDSNFEKSQKSIEIKKLEQYGQILNYKNYLTKPTIGRDDEYMDLVIGLAKEKETPILVGESGVGKTALVHELAYQIQQDNVPKFLKDKLIIEVLPSVLVSGCEYVGQFEKKLHEFIDLCLKNDVIVCINDIHSIYGVGSSKGNDNDMASILKNYIGCSNLKIIGTTTHDNYQEYFSSDDLKRRFGKIDIKEPDKETLKIIIYKVLQDYLKTNNIIEEDTDFLKNIVDIIAISTDKKHRLYNDNINNPALSISIIDTAFACLKVYESESINKEHFIQAYRSNYRLYDTTKEEAINRLNRLYRKQDVNKSIEKIISLRKTKIKK